jgi:hypothetical protein
MGAVFFNGYLILDQTINIHPAENFFAFPGSCSKKFFEPESLESR